MLYIWVFFKISSPKHLNQSLVIEPWESGLGSGWAGLNSRTDIFKKNYLNHMHILD